MNAPLAHVLLTRYNLPVPGHTQNLQAAWLTRREELFARYCVPSVAAQASQAFQWLVLLDERTPLRYRRGVEGLLPDNARVINLSAPLDDTPLAPVLRRAGISDDVPLLTSRLDSDDSLGRSYVHLVRNAAEREIASQVLLRQPAAFNLPLGLQVTSGRVYAWVDPHNPFLSLLEPAGPHRLSVLSVSHREVAALAKIQQLRAGPQWLQVVHGSNLDNSIQGVRLPGRAGTGAFGPFLQDVLDADVQQERASAVAGDVLRSASRVARLALRRAGRRAGLIQRDTG